MKRISKLSKKRLQYKTFSHEDKPHIEKALADKEVLIKARHPHEQTGYLLKGHFEITIKNVIYEILPGDAWAIPKNTWHKAVMKEDCQIFEVFTPPRKDYLELEN
jgi:quercetin dioxygenase-like cupin family protein